MKDSAANHANPLPFLILVGVVIMGGLGWILYQKFANQNYTAGKAAEKPLKEFKGDIAVDGSQFTGTWKGHDKDEDEPTNWEILRRPDKTFAAVYKHYHEEDLSTIDAKGTWSVKGKELHYKIQELERDGPDIPWPRLWIETIGDVQENRVVLQSRKTPARTGPYTEHRVAGFGYAQIRRVKIPAEFRQARLPRTEEPANSPPRDLLIHYKFNENTKNLADRKYGAEPTKASLSSRNVPESFEKALQFKDKDSNATIDGSEKWNLPAEDLTITLWLRIKGGRASGYGILDSFNGDAGTNLTGIGLHTVGIGKPGAIAFIFNHRDARYRYEGTTPVNDGEWHHVAVTKAGHLVQLYVNGQPEGGLRSVRRRTGWGKTPLILGKFMDSGLPGGAIDNFRLYKRALNPREILAIHLSEAPNDDLIKP